MPATGQFHFSHYLRVRYSEVDMQGFVFNANHVVYFQTALQEYFRVIGYDANTQDKGTDFHTVRLSVDFSSPIPADEEVEIHARTARVGRSSITFELIATKKSDQQLFSRAEIIWVNADQATHKSVPVSPNLLAQLSKQESVDFSKDEA
ncbi:MAG: acyl-CoA thioesterase [Gammaproteobacteria bacterium]|nr:acyl-CoA thioesterase [Gammaproteobacteria bacterium]